MGKVQLLPWGQEPDDIADMEDIFVDLELVKKETAIPSKESLHLDSNEDLVTLKTKRGQRINRVLVQGEGGCGKSTLLANIAYKWALQNPQSPLSRYQLVFILGMHEILDRDSTLEDLIFQQILPEDSKVSKQGLIEYISSHAKDVLLLFDGLDEDGSSILTNKSGQIAQILHNRKLRSSCVVLTTRPHRVDDLEDYQRSYVHVNVTGFSEENIAQYIAKLIQNQDSSRRLLVKLRRQPNIMAMAKTPVLLLMICLLWKDQGRLPATKTQLYRETMTYLWQIYQKKIGKNSVVDSQGSYADGLESLLDELGKVALEGLAPLVQAGEETVLFTERDIKEDVFVLGCKVGIISKERLRSKLNVVTFVTFVHKTFQEFCAGLHLANLHDTNNPDFDRYLQKLQCVDSHDILRTKPGVLEFCCGANPKITQVVMKHNASLVCKCQFYEYSADLPHTHIALGIRCAFEGQSTHNECLNYHQLYSGVDNVYLDIHNEDIAPVLHQLQLISSVPAQSNNQLFLPLVNALDVNIRFTPWLRTLLKYTPDLVRFEIDLRTDDIDASELMSFYEALGNLRHLKQLVMLHGDYVFSPDITELLHMMISPRECKGDILEVFHMKGFRFNSKSMAEFLNSNRSSLFALYLGISSENRNDEQQKTAATELLSIVPNLKKLRCLDLEYFKISGDLIKNLQPITRQLRILRLISNQLDENNLIELFLFLNMGHQLHVLDLSGNTFTVALMTSFVQFLPDGIEELYLEQASLTDDTACILAEGLKERPTIQFLGLNGNPDVGSKGHDALKQLPVQILWESENQYIDQHEEYESGR